MQEIKLIDSPSQVFITKLGTTKVKLHFKYNSVSDRWTFDVYINEVPKLHGRRVVLGTNLIAPYTDLVSIGVLVAADPSFGGVLPNRANIPSGLIKMYQLDSSELAEI